MKSATTERAAAIFFALSNVSPDRRAQILDERCGADAALRQEVERLLARLQGRDTLIDAPPAAFAGPEPLQPSGTLIGDFVVIRQIGSGGTGMVYIAHQRHPHRVVALKVLRHEFVASTVQRRFEIEAELLAHLQHPGIAQIYAAHPGDAGTPPFIAMELVNGPPLTEYADSRQLSARERVDLVARVCDAVQHAHQRGIIHRDLKPGNILVNEDGQPKVLDFGVARAAGASLSRTTIETQTGQLVGTLAYMSPEQIEATPEAIDTRSDVHALGVILFRLLTGRLPFGHGDPPLPELARRIMRDEAPRLGTIDPAWRGDLEVIVARALAKEKERRYASAEALGSDLRRYLAGEPIAAAHDSAWYIVRRRMQRYKLALAASVATLIAVAGLAFYANLQRARADRTNVEVQHQLATSTIERGRLLSVTGNLPIAEELIWRELFRRPESLDAQWALWDIYSREPSLWSVAAHDGGTLSLRFSPDGRHVLTTGQVDGLLRVLDVESGRVVRTLSATPEGPAPRPPIRRALYSPDGSTIVSGAGDGAIRIWDAASGALRRELRTGMPSLVDLALTGPVTHVATVNGAGRVEVWSLEDGRRTADLTELAATIVAIAADPSPSSTVMLAAASDGTVSALDARGSRLWQLRGHERQAISAAIAPDGRTGATGGTDGLIHLWNMATGARVSTIETENGSVRNLTFDRTGRKIVAAGQWRTKMWDLDNPEQPVSLGGAQGMTDVHIAPDAHYVATCHGASGLVRLWDLTADPRTDHWRGGKGAVSGIAVAADGQTVIGTAADGTVMVRRSGAAPLVSSVGARVSGLAMSSDKRWFVTAGYPGTAAIWDATGRRVGSLPEVRASRAVTFADSDRRLIIGDSSGRLLIWDWANGTASNLRTIESHDSEVLGITAHGSSVFVLHRDTFAVIRDAATGQEIRRLQPSYSPFSVAVSPDGRLMVAGTWPGIVDLWNLESGQKLQSLKGPTALVTAVDFSADGSLLALSSRDGSTRLWDVASGEWLATVASRTVGAERVRFLPGGRRLAIGYEDGEFEIRDLDYFFRYAGGHAEYQLRLFHAANETFPRSDEVLAWARRLTQRSR